MMKHRLRLLVVVLTLCGANHVRAQYPDPFFSDDTRPNALYFLYDPPVNSTPPEGEFYNDWWFYEWGKTQREYSYAVWDEDAELMSEEELGVYNDVIGIEIGDKVPEIILLAQRAVSDAARANKVATGRATSMPAKHWPRSSSQLSQAPKSIRSSYRRPAPSM